MNRAIPNGRIDPSSRVVDADSHGARAGYVPTLLAVLLVLPTVCSAGRFEVIVHPVRAPKGALRPPQFVAEPDWPRTRLGYVTDSLRMQLVYHPNIGFEYAEPRGGSRILRREHAMDTSKIHIGSGGDPRFAQYDVLIDGRHGDLVRPALARVRFTHGSEPPRRVLERWYRVIPGFPRLVFLDMHGRDSIVTGQDTTEIDTTLKPDPPLYRWVTHTRDTIVAQVEIDPEAMNTPVWLPAAGRWTVNGDETARYVVTAAFYWIREAHLHHRIPRRPGRAANERAWRWAEQLLNARLPGQ